MRVRWNQRKCLAILALCVSPLKASQCNAKSWFDLCILTFYKIFIFKMLALFSYWQINTIATYVEFVKLVKTRQCLGESKVKVWLRPEGGGGGGGGCPPGFDQVSVMVALLCNQPHLKISTQGIPYENIDWHVFDLLGLWPLIEELIIKL